MKYIEAQDKKTRDRINDACSKLPLGDIVPVLGHENMYRLRIGNLRAVIDELHKQALSEDEWFE